ncbi:hypothetical protein [Kitasatospora sp. MAP5-34]|uniref:hypothetical protein n=1 Tax=Kitasatospora sp. MAP5-34 TaxID=3035102 RepID=UPI002476115E|nr:hypothetical protein [Kitasatospora sp. MAP5-34]MDH6576583.1 hypothetical protein [Kitasatospora sp. MAP5-34]
MSDWPGIGFCPAPGDLGAIERLCGDVEAVARELDELRLSLADLGRAGGGWEGEAARAFAARLGELPEYLATGGRSMAACSSALRTWQTQLAGHRATGAALEAQAVELRARLKYREPGPTSQGGPGQDELDEVIGRARRQLDRHREDAEAAARAIRAASGGHPPAPGLFDQLLGGLRAAWQGVSGWLVDHADLLSTLSAGLAMAALAVSWIPVAGQAAGGVLGGAAVLCGAAALVGHGLGKARGREVSWLEIGSDALGAAPGGGAALGFATAGRAAGLGERVAAAGREVLSMTAEPLSARGIAAALERLTGRLLDPKLITLPVKGLGLGYRLGDDGEETHVIAPSATPFLRAL